MFKKILLGLLLVIVLILVIAAFQSPDFKVERSITIAAPADTPFSYVNDFHRWSEWSPWAKLDPNMKETFSGPASGTGAVYQWAGDSKVGEGRMTITESRPSDLVRIKLDFLKPFEATHDTAFTFTPQSGQTQVVWTMTGKKNFISKVMCLFVSMDKMVGGDFEKGLATLKSKAEGAAKK